MVNIQPYFDTLYRKRSGNPWANVSDDATEVQPATSLVEDRPIVSEEKVRNYIKRLYQTFSGSPRKTAVVPKHLNDWIDSVIALGPYVYSKLYYRLQRYSIDLLGKVSYGFGHDGIDDQYFMRKLNEDLASVRN